MLALLAATLWAASIAASTAGTAFLLYQALPPEAPRIVAIFALAAAVAMLITFWLAKALAPQQFSRRFALCFILLSTLTLSLTAFIFALDFWWYFAQWHGRFLSKLWFIQLVFTFASATYQFLVMGLRLYVPFGAFALACAAYWLAHQTWPAKTSR
jgi:hypothetical protein